MIGLLGCFGTLGLLFFGLMLIALSDTGNKRR